MVFVGKKQPKFPGVTKTFEKDVIFARLHIILQSLIKFTLNKKGFLKLYEKKIQKKPQKAHINVNQLKYELYFLNNQLFDDLGSHRQF